MFLSRPTNLKTVCSSRVDLEFPESSVCSVLSLPLALACAKGCGPADSFYLCISGSVNENENPRMDCHGTLAYELCASLSQCSPSYIHMNQQIFLTGNSENHSLPFSLLHVCNAVLSAKNPTFLSFPPYSPLFLYFMEIFPNAYFVLLKSHWVKLLTFEEQFSSLLFQSVCGWVRSEVHGLLSSTHRREFVSVGTHSGTMGC